jgi:hypothetical protein
VFSHKYQEKHITCFLGIKLYDQFQRRKCYKFTQIQIWITGQHRRLHLKSKDQTITQVFQREDQVRTEVFSGHQYHQTFKHMID